MIFNKIKFSDFDVTNLDVSTVKKTNDNIYIGLNYKKNKYLVETYNEVILNNINNNTITIKFQNEEDLEKLKEINSKIIEILKKQKKEIKDISGLRYTNELLSENIVFTLSKNAIIYGTNKNIITKEEYDEIIEEGDVVKGRFIFDVSYILIPFSKIATIALIIYQMKITNKNTYTIYNFDDTIDKHSKPDEQSDDDLGELESSVNEETEEKEKLSFKEIRKNLMKKSEIKKSVKEESDNELSSDDDLSVEKDAEKENKKEKEDTYDTDKENTDLSESKEEDDEKLDAQEKMRKRLFS